MVSRRAVWAVAGLVAGLVAAAAGGWPAASTAWGQAAAGRGKALGGARGRAPAARKNNAPNAADPLAAGARAAEKDRDRDKARARPGARAAQGPGFHYRLKIQTPAGVSLAASYYPAKPDITTPVVLLVHEKDRSSKDFEDPIAELKGQGLAEHLQGLGYAVLAFDLRGHGANPRRPTNDRDWAQMTVDLQAVYQFLLDRHNRGELNLARLAVVGLGAGANLVAAWVYQPGGAVSHEGRVTDAAALVLVSPLAGGSGYAFPTVINALSPRIPVLLLAGERDAASHETVKRVRAAVEKIRQNRVELFPTSLHGYKFLRLEPRVAPAIDKFLEATSKLKSVEWEPRYNLYPVTYSDIQVVRGKSVDAGKAQPEEMEKEQDIEKAKDRKGDEKGAAPRGQDRAKDADAAK
jgi:alpha-beta hydrolase superfamily lysophospholipase